MDDCRAIADEKLAQVQRLLNETAAELEYVSPHVAEGVSKIASLTRSARLDLSRELRRAGRPVAA